METPPDDRVFADADDEPSAGKATGTSSPEATAPEADNSAPAFVLPTEREEDGAGPAVQDSVASDDDGSAGSDGGGGSNGAADGEIHLTYYNDTLGHHLSTLLQRRALGVC